MHFLLKNWDRPESEVNALMTLLVSAINNETKTLMDNNIKLSTIGTLKTYPKKAKKQLIEAIEKTKNNNRMTLILALSYSGKWEILNAVKELIKKRVNPKNLNEQLFQQYLTTKKRLLILNY